MMHLQVVLGFCHILGKVTRVHTSNHIVWPVDLKAHHTHWWRVHKLFIQTGWQHQLENHRNIQNHIQFMANPIRPAHQLTNKWHIKKEEKEISATNDTSKKRKKKLAQQMTHQKRRNEHTSYRKTVQSRITHWKSTDIVRKNDLGIFVLVTYQFMAIREEFLELIGFSKLGFPEKHIHSNQHMKCNTCSWKTKAVLHKTKESKQQFFGFLQYKKLCTVQSQGSPLLLWLSQYNLIILHRAIKLNSLGSLILKTTCKKNITAI